MGIGEETIEDMGFENCEECSKMNLDCQCEGPTETELEDVDDEWAILMYD